MFANLNLSVSSDDEAKEAIFKAVSAGYNIIAISRTFKCDEKFPSCITWKILNCERYETCETYKTCERYKTNGIYKTNGNNECIFDNNKKKKNYFLDIIEKKEQFEETLLKINKKIKKNVVVVNKANCFCATNVCGDFLYHDIRNNWNKQEEDEKEEDEKEEDQNKNKIIDNVLKLLSNSNTYTNSNTNINMHTNMNIHTNINTNTNTNFDCNYFLSPNNNIYILNRININYEDIINENNMHIFSKCDYDLIAIKVSTLDELRYTLKNFNCDIISIYSVPHVKKMKKADIRLIRESGVYIEIPLFNIYTGNDIYYKNDNTAKHVQYCLCKFPLDRILFTCEDSYKNRITDPFTLSRIFCIFQHNIPYERLIKCITHNPINCLHRASVRRFSSIAFFAKAT